MAQLWLNSDDWPIEPILQENSEISNLPSRIKRDANPKCTKLRQLSLRAKKKLGHFPIVWKAEQGKCKLMQAATCDISKVQEAVTTHLRDRESGPKSALGNRGCRPLFEQAERTVSVGNRDPKEKVSSQWGPLTRRGYGRMRRSFSMAHSAASSGNCQEFWSVLAKELLWGPLDRQRCRNRSRHLGNEAHDSQKVPGFSHSSTNFNDSPRSWSTSLRWQLTSCRTQLDCTAGPTATRCHQKLPSSYQMPSGSFWPERGWRGPWRCIAVRPRDLLPAGSQHRLDTLRPHLEGVDGVEDTAAFLSQLLELGLQWATAYKNIAFLAAEWLLNAHRCTLHCLCSRKFWG